MIMDYWHMAYKCPYFKWDEKLRVGCEGKHILRFDTVTQAKKYMKSYCAGWKYDKCQHAARMNQYYEEKLDGK